MAIAHQHGHSSRFHSLRRPLHMLTDTEDNNDHQNMHNARGAEDIRSIELALSDVTFVVQAPVVNLVLQPRPQALLCQ